MLREGIILITRQLYVYFMPRYKLNAYEYGINLSDSMPVPLEYKLPSLYNNPRFYKNRDNLQSAFVLIGKRSEYLSFMLADDKGLNFDLKQNQVTDGFARDEARHMYYISSEIIGVLYFLKRVKSTYVMNRYRVKGLEEKGDNTSLDLIDNDRILCLNSRKLYMLYIIDEDNCEEFVTWPVMGGMATNGQFHLFALEKVYIFDESAYLKVNKSVSITEIAYEDYFLCKNPSSEATTLAGGKYLSKFHFETFRNSHFLILRHG